MTALHWAFLLGAAVVLLLIDRGHRSRVLVSTKVRAERYRRAWLATCRELMETRRRVPSGGLLAVAAVVAEPPNPGYACRHSLADAGLDDAARQKLSTQFDRVLRGGLGEGTEAGQ